MREEEDQDFLNAPALSDKAGQDGFAGPAFCAAGADKDMTEIPEPCPLFPAKPPSLTGLAATKIPCWLS